MKLVKNSYSRHSLDLVNQILGNSERKKKSLFLKGPQLSIEHVKFRETLAYVHVQKSLTDSAHCFTPDTYLNLVACFK